MENMDEKDTFTQNQVEIDENSQTNFEENELGEFDTHRISQKIEIWNNLPKASVYIDKYKWISIAQVYKCQEVVDSHDYLRLEKT